MMIKFPGDLIFVKSKTYLGWVIRWFERSRGESPSWTNHTAGIGSVNNVIEAQMKVISTPFDEWHQNKEFQLWRTVDLAFSRIGCCDNKGRAYASVSSRVVEYAEAQIGRKYGVMKIIPHAFDGLLSKITGGSPYVFRRMLCLENYPICSWLWAYAYHTAGLDFGGDPKRITPDDQLDYCVNHPNKWERIC